MHERAVGGCCFAGRGALDDPFVTNLLPFHFLSPLSSLCRNIYEKNVGKKKKLDIDHLLTFVSFPSI